MKIIHSDDKPKAPEVNETMLAAFVSEYQQVMAEEMADETFDYARLREFFGAQQIPKMPDPLPPYLVRLEEEGYQFRLSWSGDPALFVRKVNKQNVHYCPSLGFEETDPLPLPSPSMAREQSDSEAPLIDFEEESEEDDDDDDEPNLNS